MKTDTQTILSHLNPEQEKAVIHPDGALLVLAGAGSGKTRILTRRIAYLISRGVPAFNILGVTFTNKAAEEMRRRVRQLVDQDNHRGLIESLCELVPNYTPSGTTIVGSLPAPASGLALAHGTSGQS